MSKLVSWIILLVFVSKPMLSFKNMKLLDDIDLFPRKVELKKTVVNCSNINMDPITDCKSCLYFWTGINCSVCANQFRIVDNHCNSCADPLYTKASNCTLLENSLNNNVFTFIIITIGIVLIILFFVILAVIIGICFTLKKRTNFDLFTVEIEEDAHVSLESKNKMSIPSNKI